MEQDTTTTNIASEATTNTATSTNASSDSQKPTTTKNNSNPPESKQVPAKSAAQSKQKLEVQLKHAEMSIHHNRETAFGLHRQWRMHLFRLSFLLIAISFHQIIQPMKTCVSDVKYYNKIFEENGNQALPTTTTTADKSSTPKETEKEFDIKEEEQTCSHKNDDGTCQQRQATLMDRISGLEAIRYVAGDCICEILSFFMAVAITWFLYELVFLFDNEGRIERDPLSRRSYLLSTGLVFPIVSYYYHTRHARGGNDNMSSCIMHLLPNLTTSSNADQHEFNSTHAFPVVIVYHFITTGAIFFMKIQHNQHDKNIKLVASVRADMLKNAEAIAANNSNAKKNNNKKKKK